jgi:hypothetical protein
MLLLVAVVSSQNQTSPIAQNLHANLLNLNFETVVQVRLFGFSSSPLQSALAKLLRNYFMRTNIIKTPKYKGIPAHHSFSATAEFFDLSNSTADIESLVRTHFDQSPTGFAVYVIRSQDSLRRPSNVVARGDRWIAFRFSEAEKGSTDQTTAYRILSRIADLLDDVFIPPLIHMPRLSVKNNSAKIVVYQPPPLNAFNAVSILKQTLGHLANLIVSAVELDPDSISLICSVCADGLCTVSWLQRLPEVTNAWASQSLPIFLLPPPCAHQFADNAIALAPTKVQSALEAVARQALFGWEPSPASEPFFEIIARRNMAVAPLGALLHRLSALLRELEELRQFDAVVLPEKLIQSLNTAYGDFIARRDRYLRRLLDEGVEATLEEFAELENMTDAIVEQWALVSENVQTRRVCVGNLRDITYHPLIFMRPSFYCLLSVLGSLVMWKIILTLMRPKDVLGIWHEAEPLL